MIAGRWMEPSLAADGLQELVAIVRCVIYSGAMRAIACTSIAMHLLLVSAALATETPSQEGLDFFENKIRPVLAKNCYACH